MNWTFRLWLLIVGLLPFVAGCGPDASGDAAVNREAPRGIVLITVDGLIAAELSMRGGPEPTPNLERLAADGVVWDDVWTSSPMTRPAVATFLTGLAPDRHGVRDDLFTALRDDVPTLATLLRERGYRTAAFPNSSLLGASSGLLRGFEVVEDPPLPPVNPVRWLALNLPAEETAGSLGAWLGSLPEGDRYFAWVHFAQPLLAHLQDLGLPEALDYGESVTGGDPPETEETADSEAKRAQRRAARRIPPYEDLDRALGAILDAVDARPEAERSLVVVATTLGDARGGTEEPIGPGYSLHERALRVPLFVRFPRGTGVPSSDRAVWAPDVARTVAALAGVELSPEAEGTSLFAPADPGRVEFAWTWALLDQMGWKAGRAARVAGIKLEQGAAGARVTRLGDGAELDADKGEALAVALARRSDPPRSELPLEVARELLADRGLDLHPVAEQGRAWGTAAERRQVSEFVWHARGAARRKNFQRARFLFNRAMRVDAENKGALLDRGQLLELKRPGQGLDNLERAVELYPTDPEVVHWYAHAVWSESWEQAEPMLEALRPYKGGEADLLYDLACTRSLAGDPEGSANLLRQAIDAGFVDWQHIESDRDLRNLRESPLWAVVMREYNR